MLIKNTFYKELVNNSYRILLVLLLILPLTELFKLLDQAVAGKIPTITLLALTIYGTIASFPMILTITIFISIAIVVNRYSKENEFAVYLSCGVSPFYWYKQVLYFALPMSVICGVCTMVITPWSVKKSDQYGKFLASKQVQKLISPSVFQEFNNGKQTIYIEKYAPESGIASNIFIQYVDKNDTAIYNMTAKSGTINYEQGNISLELKQGNRYQVSRSKDNEYLVTLNFESVSARIDSSAKLEKTNSPSSYSMAQLFAHSDQTNSRKEISWRISVALMTLIMALLTLPLCIQISRVQNNLVFILPPISYALYQNIIMTIDASINGGKFNNYWATLPVHIGIVIVSLLLTYYKTMPNGYFFSKNK